MFLSLRVDAGALYNLPRRLTRRPWRPSGSAATGLSIEKKQPDDQEDHQDRKPAGVGKGQPEEQAAQQSGRPISQSSTATPTPAMMRRNGSSSSTAAATIILPEHQLRQDHCELQTSSRRRAPSTRKEESGCEGTLKRLPRRRNAPQQPRFPCFETINARRVMSRW
jgi:hypothetical protein